MTETIIVFDLDGTLVDSASDILDCLNTTLITERITPFQPSDIHRLIGMGGRIMIERALKLRQIAVTEPLCKKLMFAFNEAYSATIPGKTKTFANVDDALNNLSDSGMKFAVCTNKNEKLARKLLDALGESRRFSAICGGDSFPWKKPDPRHLLATIEKAHGHRHKAVMVGDSSTDILAAHRANIPVIAVDFGYSDQAVETYNPTAIISSFRQLTANLVEQLLEKKC